MDLTNQLKAPPLLRSRAPVPLRRNLRSAPRPHRHPRPPPGQLPCSVQFVAAPASFFQQPSPQPAMPPSGYESAATALVLKDATIADLNKQLGATKSVLDATQGTVAVHAGTIVDLSTQLNTFKASYETAKATIAMREASITDLAAQLKDSKAAADTTNAALTARDSALTARDGTVADLSNQLNTAKANLASAANSLTARDATLTARDATVAELTGQLKMSKPAWMPPAPGSPPMNPLSPT